MCSCLHVLAQVGITIEAVEREILGWDYYSVISGEATRDGIADAGHVPVTFDSLSAYSKVILGSLSRTQRNVCSRRGLLHGSCRGLFRGHLYEYQDDTL